MLSVSYKGTDRIGYYRVKQGEHTYTIWLCKANALWADMSFTCDRETGKTTAQLQGFFADLQHIKNCDKEFELFTLGGAGKREGAIVFRAKHMTPELWNVVKYLTSSKYHKYEVTIR